MYRAMDSVRCLVHGCTGLQESPVTEKCRPGCRKGLRKRSGPPRRGLPASGLQTCQNCRAPTTKIIFCCYATDYRIFHPLSSVYCRDKENNPTKVSIKMKISAGRGYLSIEPKTYHGVYYYTAADADEFSFKDGDAIVNVQDEGWMDGTVQRTGKTSMLPANYVEAV